MSVTQSSNLKLIKDPLIEPYFIQLDDYCYALHKSITAVESGKEYQQNIGFYSNLANCIKAMAKDESMKKSYNSLREYLDEYNSIVKRLESTLNI